MLKNPGIDVVNTIERFTPDAVKETITVEVVTGKIVDELFVPDGREPIKYVIANELDKHIRKVEELTVDALGQVLLSIRPMDGNQIQIDGIAQDHESGLLVDCVEHSEGDVVTIVYYYVVPGRDWFNEQAVFVKEEKAKYAGMNDHDYFSNRLWDILLEMGLVSGVVI